MLRCGSYQIVEKLDYEKDLITYEVSLINDVNVFTVNVINALDKINLENIMVNEYLIIFKLGKGQVMSDLIYSILHRTGINFEIHVIDDRDCDKNKVVRTGFFYETISVFMFMVFALTIADSTMVIVSGISSTLLGMSVYVGYTKRSVRNDMMKCDNHIRFLNRNRILA